MPFLRESARYGWPCPPCRRKEQAKDGRVASLREKGRSGETCALSEGKARAMKGSALPEGQEQLEWLCPP